MSSNVLRSELDKLALQIAKSLQKEEVPFDAIVDGFKALTAYHLGLMKKGDKPDEPDGPATPKFSQIRALAEKTQ